MASPPFNINQSIPGDSDIVSQHPSGARTFRDVVESWLLINHDVNGNHFRVNLPREAAQTAPAVAIDTIYSSLTGKLKLQRPDASEEFIGVPPGFIGYSASTVLPTGWLLADGSAVDRTTFADLFSAIGILYGPGNGSTTFNIPDLRGRVPGGAGGSAFSTNTTGAAVGNASFNISLAQLPTGIQSVSGAISVSAPSSAPIPYGTVGSGISTGLLTSGAGGGPLIPVPAMAVGTNWFAATSLNGAAVTSTSNNTNGSASSLIQPTLVLLPIVKY